MRSRSPLLLFLLAASVFPLSCSEKDGSDSTDSSTGGVSPGSGGSGISLDGSGSTGTGGKGNGEGGAGTDGGVACESFAGLEQCGSDALSADVVPVNILLVLDKSGSMDDTPPGGTTTLWDATTQALTTALEDAGDAVSFGLQLYPARGAAACEMPDEEGPIVPVGSGDETRDDILFELGRTKPGGGTPTADALARAFEYFNSGEGSDLKGDRFVLLATDGGPNCNEDLSCEVETCTANIDGKCNVEGANCCAGSSNTIGCLDDQRTLRMIEDLRDIDVDTFVVGLAGTEQYAEQLDAFAEAGGRPRSGTAEKYFKVAASGTATGLVDVLEEITTELVQTCDIQLAEEPETLNEINVAVDCVVIPNAAPPGEAGSAEGGSAGAGGTASTDSFWWLDQETSPPTVHLDGDICEMIKSEGVERIDIISGCRTVR